VEKLGQQVFDGVVAEGTRYSNTIPVDAQGNDRPIVTYWENWYSPELKIMILSRYVDPRSGENSTRLINISRAEPDPALFQVPRDYTTIDETGDFTIKFTGKQ